MARNPVQFQKGISLNEFLSLYGTEEQCFDALYRWRWPNGFRNGPRELDSAVSEIFLGFQAAKSR